MSSVDNIDFDDTLKEIAKALHKNEDIDNLGKALGFGPGDIGRKIDENAKQGGNYMGTLDLLRTWRNSQTPSTEKAALTEALIKARLTKLACQYLSTPITASAEPSKPFERLSEECSKNEEESSKLTERATGNRSQNEAGQQQETATGPSAAQSPNRSNKREVTNGEITRLSKLLPDAKYNELCENLGFGYDHLQKTLAKNFMDATGAFKEILQEWKNDGGYMEDLDAALIKAELGGLVPLYKNYTPTKGTKYGKQRQTATGPSAAPSPYRSNKREVMHDEITRLTKLLPAGKYNELCEKLGFGIYHLQSTLRKNFMDPMAAFKEILQEWKNEGGYMEDLDAALIKAELGGLVSKYKI